MSLLALLDYAAVLVFAITGALVASRAQLDIVGFAFIACLTAVGGGTIRDLLLDRNPIFWIETPSMLGVAIEAHHQATMLKSPVGVKQQRSHSSHRGAQRLSRYGFDATCLQRLHIVV